MDGDWIKLHRSLAVEEGYLHGRFDRTHAWIDLLMTASTESRTVTRRGTEIRLEPGDMIVSLRGLASRWSWNHSVVSSFLAQLEKERKVSVLKHSSVNVIRVNGWSGIQGNGTQTHTVSYTENHTKTGGDKPLDSSRVKDMFGDAPHTEKHTISHTEKEQANRQKKKEAIEERMRKFRESLVPYEGKYGKEMIEEFYLYWSEPQRSLGKTRAEKQPTWDTERRLATWARNDKTFNKRGYGQKIDDKRRGTEVSAVTAEDYNGPF